jgi:hypothetical protein
MSAPSQRVLKPCAKDVGYELRKIIYLPQLEPPTRRTTAYDMWVEAFLLHARNVLEFMWPHPDADKRKESDLYAYNFIVGNDDAAWFEVNPLDGDDYPFVEDVGTIFDNISTRLSHLCTERRDRLAWNVPEIRAGLLVAARRFMEHVKPAYREVIERHGGFYFRADGVQWVDDNATVHFLVYESGKWQTSQPEQQAIDTLGGDSDDVLYAPSTASFAGGTAVTTGSPSFLTHGWLPGANVLGPSER